MILLDDITTKLENSSANGEEIFLRKFVQVGRGLIVLLDRSRDWQPGGPVKERAITIEDPSDFLIRQRRSMTDSFDVRGFDRPVRLLEVASKMAPVNKYRNLLTQNVNS